MRTKNKNKSREKMASPRNTPESNSFAMNRSDAAPPKRCRDLMRHFVPGILKNANINLTFNRLLSCRRASFDGEHFACKNMRAIEQRHEEYASRHSECSRFGAEANASLAAASKQPHYSFDCDVLFVVCNSAIVSSI